MALREAFEMDLECPLAPAELEAKAQQLAQLVADSEEAEAQRKKASKEWRTKCDRINDDIRSTAKSVASKRERRAVRCEERYNLAHQKVEVVRLDTMEIVSERAMQSGELADARQTKLTLAGGGDTPTKPANEGGGKGKGGGKAAGA